MIIAWVLGSRGLLGAALCRALQRSGTDLFVPAERFSWGNGSELSVQIKAAVEEFSSRIGPADRWEVYWAAGVGTMGSTAEAFAPETLALSLLLGCLESDKRLKASPGAIAFASSAGAIYAGSSDEIITEHSAPAPTTDYARQKLRQEDLLRAFATANDGYGVLIARITTLYGSGQAAGKKQGLMTHIARCILRNQPIQIYVPYDTIRDYITADDAATLMVGSLRRVPEESGGITKIVASEHPATIAEIVSIFKRVARRKLRIVTSASKLSGLYSRRVQFRSVVLAESGLPPPNRLPIGIFNLMTAERAAFVRASLTEVE